jgi:uncharacterized protein (TIGR03790 family)
VQLLAGLALMVVGAGGVGQAATPGEEVVVLFNKGFGPESRAVAEHYARVRGVPEAQLIGFSLPKTEAISRAVFQDDLQRPLVKALESRGLVRFPEGRKAPTTPVLPEAKVRYLVLAYGMPLKIAHDPKLVEKVPDALGPQLRRNEAAVDSELACLPLLERGALLTGPIRNALFATTNVAALHPTNGLFLVTRLDGPTFQIASNLVDRAVEAETNGLWGRAWFDERSQPTNSAYAKGDVWIREAYLNVRRQGFESVLDLDPVTFPDWQPLPQIALYGGWYNDSLNGPFRTGLADFMPGAIAYHLHSFSARTLRSTGAGWVGPLLARGVTATMGCVEEPYLDLTPHVGVFFAWMISLRHNFAEAAYASQPVLSWQTTVVGDPLYRPMARRPHELHQELEARHRDLVPWSHLRVVNLNLATGEPPLRMAEYLAGLPATRTSPVLLEKLGELYRELRREPDAIEAYRAALELQPAPNHKLHLRFRLIDALVRSGREAEALQQYGVFFQENPNYPGQPRFFQAALGLARKLGETALAERYDQEVQRLTPPPAASTNSPAATNGPGKR